MQSFDNRKNVEFIADCCVKACILEAYSEKPGNVTPTKSFADTTYTHYILGSRALKPVFASAAAAGFKAGREVIHLREVGVGKLIKDGTERVRKSHGGGNTHLGIIMLLVPVCAGAGLCIGRREGFGGLKDAIGEVLFYATVQDAVDLFDAVNLSGAGGLGEADLDVRDEGSGERIRAEGLRFGDVLEKAAERDNIAGELVNGLPITFETGAPLFMRLRNNIRDIKDVIIQVYLALLSKHPDTLVARKCGKEKAEEVRKRASQVLDAGGVLTAEGRQQIAEFDSFLRSDGNRLNPGTTADLVTSSFAVALLNGLRI